MNQPGIWPDGAQCAAVLTVNFDGESVEQREFPNQLLWGRNSFGRYGAQAGIYRILDLFSRYETTATFFIPAWDAERYPEAMNAIIEAGHEVAGHGYILEDFSKLDLGEQADVLRKSEATFGDVFGALPRGWRAPGGLMTTETRSLLASRGYLYDSSYCDDDVPYLVENGDGNRLIEIPVFETASDNHYYALRRPPDVVARAWAEEFDAVYEVGSLYNLTIHPRGDTGSGRAVRIRAVESILQRMQERPKVWRATCAEVAAYVMNGTTA